MEEEKYYQRYILVLSNGKEIWTYEDEKIPFEVGLIANYEKCNDEDIMVISLGMSDCRMYIPKKNILYIYEGDIGTINFFARLNDNAGGSKNENPCT